ncbi:MAG TPA: protein phosphatase 2C domain-containing protein [Candidatus Solibacter sp.]|nr:protein phosphatase 2C domain-containing protein [Candidatus Solibacter sp.]
MRPQNEDSLGWGRIGVLENQLPDAEAAGLVFVIADGLGAYGGGDVASKMAVETLLGHAARHAGGQVKPPKLLRAAFEAANLDIFHAALDGAGTAKMQTTMSALVLSPGEAHLGHVGDGRVYRRQGEEVDLLTTDHTQVMEMLRMRMITAEQAAEHPARHALTRSLGAELITRTDIRQEPLVAGDTFLLCTDGLWGKVDVSEIRTALASDDLEAACADLVAMAVDRGGEDNSTIVMVRVTHTAEAAEKPAGWRRFFQ